MQHKLFFKKRWIHKDCKKSLWFKDLWYYFFLLFLLKSNNLISKRRKNLIIKWDLNYVSKLKIMYYNFHITLLLIKFENNSKFQLVSEIGKF